MKQTLALLTGLLIWAGVAHAQVKVSVVTTNAPDGKPMTTFAPDTAALHAVIKTTGVQKGDQLRAVWFAEDVGEMAPPNTKLDDTTATLDRDTNNGDFSVSKPSKGWPPGKYRVEIYAREQLAASAKFTVQDGGASEPAAVAVAGKKKASGAVSTVKFPENDPAFTIEFPASWTYKRDEDGNLALKAGEDDTFSCSLLKLEEVRNNKDLTAALPEVANAIAAEMKLQDFQLGKISTDKNGNDVSFTGILGDGTYKGIEFTVMVQGFEAQEGRVFALVTAATTEADAKHEKDHDEVTASIMPIEE